jgi:hypothetical protein
MHLYTPCIFTELIVAFVGMDGTALTVMCLVSDAGIVKYALLVVLAVSSAVVLDHPTDDLFES